MLPIFSRFRTASPEKCLSEMNVWLMSHTDYDEQKSGSITVDGEQKLFILATQLQAKHVMPFDLVVSGAKFQSRQTAERLVSPDTAYTTSELYDQLSAHPSEFAAVEHTIGRVLAAACKETSVSPEDVTNAVLVGSSAVLDAVREAQHLTEPVTNCQIIPYFPGTLHA